MWIIYVSQAWKGIVNGLHSWKIFGNKICCEFKECWKTTLWLWNVQSGLQIRECNWKLIFLFLNQNIMLWLYPKHMLKLMD